VAGGAVVHGDGQVRREAGEVGAHPVIVAGGFGSGS
jgi:hypothetical protein